MDACVLTITTTTDGQESTVSYDGELKLFVDGADIRYQDGQSTVIMEIRRAGVSVLRQGDYTLKLRLEEGKRKVGAIGIGGSEGEVFTQTEKLAYSVSERSLLLKAEYALLIGGERQEMKLRIHAKRRG